RDRQGPHDGDRPRGLEFRCRLSNRPGARGRLPRAKFGLWPRKRAVPRLFRADIQDPDSRTDRPPHLLLPTLPEPPVTRAAAARLFGEADRAGEYPDRRERERNYRCTSVFPVKKECRRSLPANLALSKKNAPNSFPKADERLEAVFLLNRPITPNDFPETVAYLYGGRRIVRGARPPSRQVQIRLTPAREIQTSFRAAGYRPQVA